jgi:cyclophilin family peptidyl-prolyl cis-trans isomerase
MIEQLITYHQPLIKRSNYRMNLTRLIAISTTAMLLLSLASNSQATIVQFETNLGNFEVNLYDQGTPETVANFLEYVNAGDYDGSVIHRTVPGFIVQGGGFKFETEWPVVAIESNPAVVNEPVFSNIRGTISMAKLGNDPNSATNQWFFNLADNSLNLDRQNSGFTVFGTVTGDGMNIIDSMAEDVARYNFGSSLAEIPLQNYDIANTPDETNFLIITSIQVIDSNVDSAIGLNKPLNIGPAPTPEPTDNSGGGVFDWMISLLCLTLLRLRTGNRQVD